MNRILFQTRRFAGFLFFAGLSITACTSQEHPPVSRTAEPADLAAEESRLRGSLASSPDDPELTFSLARVLADREKTEESVEYFTETVLLDPGMAGTVNRARRSHMEEFLREGESLLEEGRIDEAQEALEQAEIMLPNDGRTAFLRGRTARESGDLEAAVPLFRAALESDKENREYQETLSASLLALGQRHYEEGRFETAYELLSDAETISSGLDLQYLRGMVAYAWARNSQEETEKLDRLAVAAESFRKVLEKDPDDQDARFNLGAVLLASERYPEAAEVYRELILENREDGRLFSALSRAHSLSGMNEAALTEDAIGRALRTGEHVDNPEMWSYRAAERFPETSLAETHAEHGTPEEVVTYTVPGGGLVEVWFYWEKGRIQAFREGGDIGAPFLLGDTGPAEGRED